MTTPYPLDFPPGLFRNGTQYQAKGRWHKAQLVRFLEDAVRPIGGWETLTMTVDSYTPIATDSADGTDGVEMDDVVGLVGFTGWKVDTPAAVTILSNKYRVAAGVGGGAGGIICEDAVTSDAFDYRASVVPSGASSIFGLIFRATEEAANWQQNGDGLYIELDNWLGSGDTATADVQVYRRVAGTATALFGTPPVQDITIPLVSGIDLGITVSGSLLSVWTEPYGGGTRTTHSSGIDLTTLAGGSTDDFNDGTHQRFGINRGSNGEIGTVFENIQVHLTASSGIPGGAIRQMIGWRENSASAVRLGIGAHNGLYVFSQGATTNITPTDLTQGTIDSEPVIGLYGGGLYGSNNYGEGDPAQGALVEAGVWQLDTFGDYLVGVLKADGRCFQWTGSGVATVMTNSPVNCDAIVVTPERFIVALGASGDPRLVKWASQESLTVWTAADGNTAGELTLPGPGVVMCGRRGRNETLIFTDRDLFALQYIGGTLVYRITQVGSTCGAISRNAVAIVDGRAIWMGQRGFFTYDGYVNTLDSDVADYVFSDFNRTQRAKIWTWTLTDFKEVWWFYPSSTSAEPDRYVIYNYNEKHWTTGDLQRTAGVDRNAFEYPMMADLGFLYDHERGTTRTGATTPSLESGPVELGDGERLIEITELYPDESTQAGQAVGNVRAYLEWAQYPTGTETESGPFTLANPSPVRITARQVRLKIEEVTAGDWRVGILRLLGRPGGRR